MPTNFWVGTLRPALFALAGLVTLAAGCAPQRPPEAVVALPRPKPGYDRLADSLGSVDPRGLHGRRIVLDPGHGGFFRGAIGVHGLTEAEVNLRVALRLRDLLRAAGAQVLMTRSTDRDYLTPQDSALRADLAERVRLAEAFGPDLFLSIHHNADPGGRHDVNETQTYYRLGDEGPSLDVAQDVHRSLVRNVGIATNKVAAGNYYVLRSGSAPAILTETSYITDPDVEARLRLPEKQELEAEALYLGLARYFDRPVPRIRDLVALDPDDGRPDSVFAAGVALRAEVDGEFDTDEFLVDDAPAPATRVGNSLVWLAPAPLSQGAHHATLRVRLTGVGAARERSVTFRVQRPPATLALESLPARVPRGGGALGVRIAVLDAEGLPDPDSTAVRVIVRPLAAGGAGARATVPRAGARARVQAGAAAPAWLDTLVIARDGAAWAYAWVPAAGAEVRASIGEASPRRPADDPRAQRARGAAGGAGPGLAAPAPHGQARAGHRSAAGPHGPTASLRASGAAPMGPGIRAQRRIQSGSAAWSGFVRSMPGDSALENAPGTREPVAVVPWLTRDGFAVLERDSAGAPVVPELLGFRVWARPDRQRGAVPAFTAIAGGALQGRRIVLDPDAGGDQPGGVGKGGTRAANLNLEVARALAGLLRAAGAEVRLTREGNVALSELERVQINEAFHADRFLRIGHRPEPPRIGYYFSSIPGRRWAEHVAAECPRVGLAAPAPAEDAQYPLQQTSCPSIYVSLARIDDPAAEDRLLSPGALHAEAWALMLGLAREFGAGPPAADSVEVRDDDGRPLAGAAVRLGGALVTETDTRGIARFARTEAGPLEVEVQHPRAHRRRVLLDSDHGTVLTGPP